MHYDFHKQMCKNFTITEVGFFNWFIADAWGRKEPTTILGVPIHMGELLTTIQLLSIQGKVKTIEVKKTLKKFESMGLISTTDGKGNQTLRKITVLNYERDFYLG